MGQHFDFVTKPKVDIPTGAYLADFLTDKAVDFIETNKDGPFFLYLHHFGVHAPHQAKKELIAKFKAKPPRAATTTRLCRHDRQRRRERRPGLAKLDELKLAENTLVIFTSDNGGVGGYAGGGVKAGRGITDNAPLRGGKGMLYEGGVRVPCIVALAGQDRAGNDRRADQQRRPLPDPARLAGRSRAG